jgi:integrase
MPRQTVPLSDKEIRNAKLEPGKTIKALFDGGGLFLEIHANGAKRWRMKYRIGDKEKRLTFGTYPIVSLREARERRDEAKKLLANSTDPGAVREKQRESAKTEEEERKAELERETATFEKATWEWFNAWSLDKAPSNAERIKGRLMADVLPWIGQKPIADISSADIFQTCDRIQKRGAKDTAHRVLGYLDAIFKHVIAVDSADKTIYEGKRQARIPSGVNPCTNLRGRNVHLLEPSPPKKHFAHFRDGRTGGVSPVKLGEYLRAVDGFTGSYIVHAALRLAPLLFCRPGELRRAKWSEFDLEGRKDWCFTISKVKQGDEPHKLTVPLPHQAVQILEELRPLTGEGEFVFMGHRDRKRPMSDAAVNAAIRRLSFDTQREITGHGFRHVAASLLRELGYRDDLVEEALGHKKPGIAGVYGHAKYIEERRAMMQTWADYLDKLKAGADVIPLRGNAA